MFNISRKTLLGALIGFFFGMLWVFSMRFIFYSPEEVHYHANFGVFINGEREQFESFTYYEEVTSCTQDESENPRGRVHLHQPDNYVVHVHDNGATWGNLFENMGLNLTNSSVQISNNTYTDGEGGELVFILNGESTRSIANTTIGDTDKLLISFGDSSTDVMAQYNEIPADASEFNDEYDPGGCSGSGEPTLRDRFNHAFDL